MFRLDKCQPFCNLCKVADIPKCIQQYEDTLLGYYDFAPPKYFYNRANPDLSPNNNNLNQMALDTNFNEPTAINTGNDPVHVDRQGLLFESDNKRLRGNINFRVQSFSVEAWVRFDSNPLANNQRVVSGGGN